MTTHTAFIRRLAELTRSDSVVWTPGAETPEYTARVENYTARLRYPPGARNGATAASLRFELVKRDEVVAEISARRSQDFQTSDDSAYALKTLFEAVQRQQNSRETAAFEDFLSRAEA